MIVVELGEWDRVSVNAGQPTLEDLDLAAGLADDLGRKLDLRWLRDGRLEIISSSWVGVVNLSTVSIRVRPKYAGDELGVLRMLEYVGGGGSIRRAPSTRSLATDGHNLIDLLCLLLAEEAERLIRGGLISAYQTEEESLPHLRGSLRYRDQATKRFGQLDVLECRYDDFHADVLDNQLLRAGLTAASRATGDRALRRRLRRLDGAVGEAASIGPLDADYFGHQVAYDRRNEHYRGAHGLSLLLLEKVGVHDLYAGGSTRSFAFLLDMNSLFENFVAQLVTEAFAGESWTVRTSAVDASVIRNKITGRSYARIIPDLVLGDGHRKIPFDCKYKLYGTSRKISTSDIYQTFLYAHSLTSQGSGTPCAGIIYPSRDTSVTPKLEIRRSDQTVTATIAGIAINLAEIVRGLDDRDSNADTLVSVREVFAEVLTPVDGGAGLYLS